MSRSLLLVGTGLVGGSFALAARRAGLFDRVLGMDASTEAIAEAQAHGVIDAEATQTLGDVAGICVAVPVAAIAQMVRYADARLPGVPVFDVGSVKKPVLEALAPEPPPSFVPCHPIAGSERQGAAAADGAMFRGARVVLTPTEETDPEALATVQRWWQAVGAETVTEDAAVHDDLLAVTSHVPHLVAFALMRLADDAGALGHVGGGFRDFTRIAGADPDVWSQILAANSGAVTRRLSELSERLAELASATRKDPQTLRAAIAEASRIRRGLDAER
ncbi:MAG: prephenate dehydrogenase [Gammaproteobacteria bacterium]|nr:prephenate dehydrogenase [Gammaproteobacteria bacterium]